MALRAAAASGLDVVGIDFLTRDISRSYKEVGGAICELNAQPGLRAHHLPNEGKPRDAAGSIIDLLYPPGKPSRIPTAVITGSQADTMTAYMLGHVCKLAAHRVGMAINGEVYIDNPGRVDAGLSAPRAVHMILSDCLIDAAVFQIAPAELAEHGLGFDACDVAAVQNMGERRQDTSGDSELAMRIVLEGARHAVVLNADDEECRRMAEQVQGRQIVYVTSHEKNPVVDAHVAAGGCAVRSMLKGGAPVVTVHDNGVVIPIAQVLTGASRPDDGALPSIHSVMIAAAMAYAMGKTLDEIRCGISTCEGGYLERLGGMRVYRGVGPTVFLDDIDSIASVEGLCRLASRLECAAPRVVIIYPPGNARIEDINAVAAITAGCFDRYILTRTDSASASDYTMNQFKAALTASHVSTTSIELVRNDREAIDAALKFTTQQGQIVILTQNVERACRYLSYHDLRAQSGNENQRSLRRPIPLPRIKLRSPAIASSDRKAQK